MPADPIQTKKGRPAKVFVRRTKSGEIEVVSDDPNVRVQFVNDVGEESLGTRAQFERGKVVGRVGIEDDRFDVVSHSEREIRLWEFHLQQMVALMKIQKMVQDFILLEAK